MSKRMILVVLGKQGAGKGTQCARLADKYKVPHVSTGDILRAAVKDNTPLGLQIQAVMDAGKLVSDELIVQLVNDRLAQSDAVNGALLDGCTRTRAQAEALEIQLGSHGVALALNLDVPTSLVMARISSRRVCQECGTIYRDTDPAAVSGTCEKCGGDVIQRADDTPAAIQQRLDAYEHDTAPVLDFYRDRELLVTINGDQNEEKVSADIDEVLRGRGLI